MGVTIFSLTQFCIENVTRDTSYPLAISNLGTEKLAFKNFPSFNWIYQYQISSQAGLRADGAGESALPAEESPWRLRALSREREL